MFLFIPNNNLYYYCICQIPFWLKYDQQTLVLSYFLGQFLRQILTHTYYIYFLSIILRNVYKDNSALFGNYQKISEPPSQL